LTGFKVELTLTFGVRELHKLEESCGTRKMGKLRSCPKKRINMTAFIMRLIRLE